MSRVAVTVPAAGDDRDAADVNAIWDALETASGSVGEENLAEEGLDGPVFVAHLVGERIATVQETVRNAASLAAGGAYAQFVQNGTAFRTGALGALAADEVLRVRFRTFLATHQTLGLGLTGQFRARLVYNDGATTKIDYSEAGAQRRPLQPTHYHAAVVTEGWLFGPKAGLNWVEAQFTLSVGGVAFPSKSFLTVTKYYRPNRVT